MKNVKLIKVKKGYFLTIGETELGIENTWAVTALELLTLLKMLKEREQDLISETVEEENVK